MVTDTTIAEALRRRNPGGNLHRRKAGGFVSAPVEMTLPIRVVSEMNARDHWTKRRKRFDAQRAEVIYSLRALPHRWNCALDKATHYRVTLTRVAPRRFDDDNLRSAFKAVRDAIANEILFIDDGSERITWDYSQESGKPKEYAIRILIEAALQRKEG